jgi:hypothetical protein
MTKVVELLSFSFVPHNSLLFSYLLIPFPSLPSPIFRNFTSTSSLSCKSSIQERKIAQERERRRKGGGKAAVGKLVCCVQIIVKISRVRKREMRGEEGEKE